jgi:hypothetical protein
VLGNLRQMDAFLVRVWKPDGDERPEGLRGTAVQLSSGREVTFTEAAALVSFLSDAGGPQGELAPAASIDQDEPGSIGHV